MLSWLAEKYRIKILVIILLLVVIVVSLFVLVPYQIAKLVRDYGEFVKFGTFC